MFCLASNLDLSLVSQLIQRLSGVTLMFEGPLSYLGRLVAERGLLTPDGIDHFGASSPSLSLPSTPFRSTCRCLKVGPLNHRSLRERCELHSGVWGNFNHLETLLVTKECVLFYARGLSYRAHSWINRAHKSFVSQ